MNHKAILALYSQVVTVSDDIALDINGDQVTLNEALVNAWVDPDTYKYNRVAAYPSIGDQLDLLYKDMVAGKGDSTGEWFKAVKAVKDANPKP
tara:strand:- start:34 stop:312 length:279 start_codon:yes stop_codon:yes gene_type:complete